jgi:Asp-tRNA(Asn)/Glu-tRNA(Gln) amidotransferase A subunit family amidase
MRLVKETRTNQSRDHPYLQMPISKKTNINFEGLPTTAGTELKTMMADAL